MINLEWLYNLTLYALSNIEPSYNIKIYGTTIMRNESTITMGDYDIFE